MATIANTAVVATELSPRQSLFVDGLMLGKNATQAYIDAGYSAKGADGAACKLQGVARVAAEIARRKATAAQDAGITRAWVLGQYKKRIEAKLSDLFDDQGALLPPKQWPEHLQDVVLKVKVQEMQAGMGVGGAAGVQSVPMYTKEVALEAKFPALGKLLDMVDGKPEVELPAAQVTNQTQINIDKLILDLSAAPISA